MKSATPFGKRAGLQDWLLQRISAVILALYIFSLLGYGLLENPLSYERWHALFACTWMRIFSLAALFSLLLHAWIGLWTISTDYLKKIWLRACFQLAIFIALITYFVWGVRILWGVVG